MRNKFHRAIARLRSKNLAITPPAVIIDQLNEPRALPMGRSEFDSWSARIIGGALVSADHSSQRYVLANMLLHLGPTESHKPDAHFIHSLRKYAVNQVADEIRKEIFAETKARTAAEEAKISFTGTIEGVGNNA